MIEQLLQADRLLQVDQIDKARDMYRRVAELDPGNAIARVGLAQCALADGDDREAHDLAAQALQIDPENDMARRMEARLAEILTVRGETVERPVAAEAPGSRAMRPVVTEAVPADVESKHEAISLEPADMVPPSPATSPGATVTRPDPKQTSSSEAAAPPSPSTPLEAPTLARPVARRSLLDRLMGR